jgi:hypothetical protein
MTYRASAPRQRRAINATARGGIQLALEALGGDVCALVVEVGVAAACVVVATALERCGAWSSGNRDQSCFSPAVGSFGAGPRVAA